MNTLAPGTQLYGFEILSVRTLEEFQAEGIWARHLRTGCQVYHLRTSEPDNLFAFTFKTPPKNSTGVAHILEHTVLCGSERFPVKDPFLLLLKGSMHTYMNALTFPDKTVYPASSQVEQDFYNLFLVYGDAVFFPLLRKETFLQEGHRRELTSEGKLEPTGIVFNEMKGNYSSHDSIVTEWAYRSLFENSPYAFDSGGEPEEILNLTYEEFVAFHRTYYHPSNCYVFFFGNLPTERHLEFLETHFLSRFRDSVSVKSNALSDLTPVPRWQAPKRVVKSYPSGDAESVDRGSSITVNWLLGQATDPLHVVSFEVLTEALLGHAGAPLEKALIESGLGEDLSPATGLETETLELAFSVGLRGTSPKKENEIEELIFSVLKGLSEKGIQEEILEGAIRRVEFRNREVKAGASFGMRLMRRALRGWIHGETPERTLEFRPWMERLKEEHHRNPRFFEGLIQQYFLNNPHRTTLVVVPEKGLDRKIEEALRAKLEQEASLFTPKEWEALQEDLDRFRRFQASPDSEEALKRIPSLRLEDIPKGIDTIPTVPLDVKGAKGGWAHDVFTNGIVYLDLAIDLEGTEKGPFLFLPLFATALSEIGAGGKPYDRIALELQLKTGGFGASLEAGTLVGGGQRIRQFLFLRLKTLESSFSEGLDLLKTILHEPDFQDTRRLTDVFLEYRNDLKSSIIPNGSSYAASRAERGISEAEAREELWKGISQYLFIHSLRGKRRVEGIAERFWKAKECLFSRDRWYVNLTCPQTCWKEILPPLEGFLEMFPAESSHSFVTLSRKERYGKEKVPKIEGLIVPSTVGFLAKAVPGSLLGSREYAHEAVLAHLLSTSFLWEKIRMEGGAYGAHCTSHGREEVFSFSSYRDPHIVPTLKAFRESLEWVALRTPEERATADAIIGTVSKDMRPLSPSGKSIVSFKRSLYGIDDSLRARHRILLLETRPMDLKAAAERLLSRFDEGYTSILAGNDALREASKAIPDLQDHIQVIPL
ncbi:MAG: insulinase family protein [Spirochaetes bacterium]|nr:insulinase family protein [Spirochaetota bacterium]